MKNYINFNPVRTLAAFGGLVQAVLLMFAHVLVWDQSTLLLAEGVQTAALLVISSLFVESRTASVAGMNALQVAKDAAEVVVDEKIEAALPDQPGV